MAWDPPESKTVLDSLYMGQESELITVTLKQVIVK